MKIVFIGNRYNVLKQLIDIEKNCKIFVLKDSFLHKILIKKDIEFELFTKNDKDLIINNLLSTDFDILISNGCPFILPIKKFPQNRLFINIHPTYLPYLRGATPINGTFYYDMQFWGATMHFMTDKVDAGNIIYQQKEPLTPDIDLGLLYFLSFELEGEVFKKGWTILKKHNFKYSGIEMDISSQSYFNRKKELQKLDFKAENTDKILKKIKAFGILTQGCEAEIKNKKIKIFDAEKIVNQYIINKFKSTPIGEILLEYDRKLLIKTKDGIIKITRYEYE